MSAKNPNPVKGIDLPSHAEFIGRDSNGFKHYYSAYEGTVYVLRNGKRHHVEEFDDPIVNLAEWIHELEERDGWEELQYNDGEFLDVFKEAFADD